jgi:seryl-tRNA(Sec) selenium transferase
MTGVRDVMCMRFLAVDLREITSGDKVMNGLSDGGLMNGSQILVNLMTA